MKIKTKLHLIIAAVIILFTGIVFVSVVSEKQAEKQWKQQILVMELNMAIFERVRVREEYFLYREDRSKEQFLLIHKRIGGLLGAMSGTFIGPEEKASLIKMMGFHNKIGGFWGRLVSLDQGATVHNATTQALRERIVSQMLVNAHSQYREGSKLLQIANEETGYRNNLAHLYSTIVFGLLALSIVTSAVIIIRGITYPLTRLHKGTEIIAEGNLDYKTNIRTPDEIGQLSTALDAMTENLRKITVSRDELSKEIEARKRVEEALSEQKLLLETILDSIAAPVFYKDLNGTFLGCNSAYLEYQGFTREGVLGKTVFDLHPTELAEVYDKADRDLIGSGGRQAYETIVRFTDGLPHNVMFHKAVFRNAEGCVSGIVGVIIDITERKRAEETLKKSVQLLRDTGEMAKVGGWEMDLSTKVVLWTEEVSRIHGVEPGYQPKVEEAINFYAPEFRSEVEAAVKKAAETGEPYDFEALFIPRDSQDKIWVRTVGKAVYSGGKIVGLTGAFQDIDNYKRAEEELRDSLMEKDVLLREVHHRVKNNLATIIGLIHIGQAEVKDSASATLMKQLESRIRSMLLIHEGLYQSENLARIAFQGYIETLLSHLHSSFAPQGAVRISVAAAGVELGLDAAVPCGLIVNEWVTNVFKHAFPGGRPRPGEKECAITVSAEQNGDATTLTVADNGVGLPADFDWAATKTMGLRLVQMLGQHQLGGTIEVDRARGTRFSLTFNSAKKS
jgi:PAS domain S-box-containing protein